MFSSFTYFKLFDLPGKNLNRNNLVNIFMFLFGTNDGAGTINVNEIFKTF